MVGRFDPGQLRRLSGMPLRSFSLCKLLWMREHLPAAWARTVHFVPIADYINLRLTGQLAVSPSLANRTLLYSSFRNVWLEEVKREFDLAHIELPALVAGGEPVGPVTAEAALAVSLRVLRVDHVGICGSDIHAYYDRHRFIQLPIVLRHEAAGVVTSIGAQVSRLAVGDRVVIQPTLACGQCERCLSGRPHICDRLRVVGCQFSGAFAEYVVIPEENAIHLPDHVSLQHGAMVEPLADATPPSYRARCLLQWLWQALAPSRATRVAPRRRSARADRPARRLNPGPS